MRRNNPIIFTNVLTEENFPDFVEKRRNYVLKICRNVLERFKVQTYEIDDLYLEILVSTLDYLRKHPGLIIDHPASFLGTAATNIIINHLERGIKDTLPIDAVNEDGKPIVQVATPNDTPERAALRNEQILNVRAAVQRLTPSLRRVMEAELDGMDQQEIADHFGMTYSAVRSARHRARESLKTKLQMVIN